MKSIFAFALAFVAAGSIAMAHGEGHHQHHDSEDPSGCGCHGGDQNGPNCDETTTCEFDTYAHVAVPLECYSISDFYGGCIERSVTTTADFTVNVGLNTGNRRPGVILVAGDALDRVIMSDWDFSLTWQPAPGQDATGNYTSGGGVNQDTEIELNENSWVSTSFSGNNFTNWSAALGGVNGKTFRLNGAPGDFGGTFSAYEDGTGWAAIAFGGMLHIASDQQRGQYSGSASVTFDYNI